MKITNSLAVMLLLGVADADMVAEAMTMQGVPQHNSQGNSHELVRAKTKVLNNTHPANTTFS